MRVIVCGGHDYNSPNTVEANLDAIHSQNTITALMQGGASGADKFADDWAARHPDIQRHVCHADWKTHGRAAGPIRNARMLEWKPDIVIAFPGGAGTANMVKQARKAGVYVIELA
jgi:hypothetical protein